MKVADDAEQGQRVRRCVRVRLDEKVSSHPRTDVAMRGPQLDELGARHRKDGDDVGSEKGADVFVRIGVRRKQLDDFQQVHQHDRQRLIDVARRAFRVQR